MSCGCISAVARKATLLPGESSAIDVTFDLRGRSGHQEKEILVYTDTEPNNPAKLTLSLDIVAAFLVTPRVVWWLKDYPLAELSKSVDIRSVPEEDIEAKIVSADGKDFKFDLETSDKPSHYILRLSPLSVSKEVRNSIKLQLTSKSGRTQTVTIYALVK